MKHVSDWCNSTQIKKHYKQWGTYTQLMQLHADTTASVTKREENSPLGTPVYMSGYFKPSEVSGAHGGEYEDDSLLGYSAVLYRRS
jgi:hypothetical protein